MRRLIAISIAFFLFFVVKGQEGVSPMIPRVIPPGPTAAELGRYGLVPVNMHTGNTNMNIPFYEFKTKNLSVPVSLSYNSSAIHVDEVASWVGMHWSLNAGGVITRLVRDQTDRPSQIPYPQDFSTKDEMSLNYVMYNGPIPEALDTEPDLFSYNFLGYTGKLVFDRDGTPIAMPRNDLVFEGSFNNNFLNGFIVTTPDGVKYSFKEAEFSTTNPDEGIAPTAWYLTKIKHPLGDSVVLTYETENYGYPISVSSTSTRGYYFETTPFSCAETCPGGSDNTLISHISMQGKNLASIESPGYGSVTFQATTGRSDIEGAHKLSSVYVRTPEGHAIKSFTFDYVFSNNTEFKNHLGLAYEEFLTHRMFLTRVVERDRHTNEIKEHSFEYDDINALPARFTNARDHWGYFNGVNNSHPFPETLMAVDYLGRLIFPQYNADRNPNSIHAKKGLLKKITYPTGGSSEFSYEGNTYFGSHRVYPNKHYSYLEVSGVQEQDEDRVYSRTITSGVTQNVRLNITCNYQSGYSSTSGGGKWIVYNEQGQSVYSGLIGAGQSQTEYVLLSAGQYTISVIAEGPPPDGIWHNNTITTLNFYYYPTIQSVTENIETGGTRIASVKNHDSISGKDEIINYHYARHDQLSQSSGKKLGSDPYYITRFSFETECRDPTGIDPLQCTPMFCSYVALHSSGMNTLFRQNGNHIYYEYVTISRGVDMGTGLEEHQFIVSSDRPGNLVWGHDDIPGTPLSNFAWDNGLEKAIRYYKKEDSNLVLLKKVENEYTKDNRYYKEIPGLSFRTNYWSDCYGIPVVTTIVCDLSDIEQNYHPCNGHNEGDVVHIPSGILDMVDAVEYLNISYWFYLSKQTVTTYDENGLNPVVQVTDYFYDNDAHTQLARQVTTSSTGKSLESRYKYARDYQPIAGDVVELMSSYSYNMVGIPIEQIQKVDGVVVAASATDYDIHSAQDNEFIAPKDIYKYETSLPGAGFNESPDGKTFASYTKKATIQKYDDNGNILEVSNEGDIAISYLWGYEGKYPIAKVENARNISTAQQLPFTDHSSAEITGYLGELPILPPFEISLNQQINVTFGLMGVGSNLPSHPLITFTLKKINGTTARSINGVWGQHTYTALIDPGTYQWYYSTGDVSFSPPDLTSVNVTVSNSYVSKRTGSQLFHTSFEEDGNHSAVAYTGEKSYQGPYTFSLPAQNGNYTLSYMKWNETLQQWEFIKNDVSVTSGTVQPMTIGNSGTIIDEVRLYPTDALMTTYTYTPQIGMTSLTDANNITSYYEYDSFGRLKLIRDKDGNILKSFNYHYVGQSLSVAPPFNDLDENFIISNAIQIEGVEQNDIPGLPVESNLQSIVYFDGLGRPSQNVTRQGSPTGKDIVQPITYDELGREKLNYLPFVSQEDNGWSKSDPVGEVSGNYPGSSQYQFYQNADKTAHDTQPYAETIFEPSPLNRVLKQGSPGQAWQPNGNAADLNDHTIKMGYETNQANQVILFEYDEANKKLDFSNGIGYYAANELFATKTYDEENHQVIEFKDKEGKVVLKRVEAPSSEWADTYYVYDDFGNLVVVLPPEGVKQLLTSLN